MGKADNIFTDAQINRANLEELDKLYAEQSDYNIVLRTKIETETHTHSKMESLKYLLRNGTLVAQKIDTRRIKLMEAATQKFQALAKLTNEL